jgi:hypothetical protein
LPDEADEGNDLVHPLDAVETVSDYWEDSPQPKNLHILVQKPAGAPQNTPQYLDADVFFSITRPSIHPCGHLILHLSTALCRFLRSIDLQFMQ